MGEVRLQLVAIRSKLLPTASASTLLLFVILLAAFVLRIYQLNVESLWIDEATSINIAQNNLNQLLSSSLKDGNPPLYYLLLHFWMQLFGDSEFSVRLPSLLFSVLSVAMLYKVGVLLFSKCTGLISALIFALSAYQVYYAQEARTYSMMVLLTLVSFYFFWKLFEKRNYKVLTGYVLSTTCLLYSHYYGAFFVAAQALFVLGAYSSKNHRDKLPSLKTWILVGEMMTALYLPGIFYLSYSLSHPVAHNWIKKPDLATLYTSFAAYAGAPAMPSPQLLSVLTLFALVSVVLLARSKAERVKLYLLLLWLVIPISLPFLLSQASAPIYVDRYSMAAVPALYLLAAEGMQRMSSIVGGIQRVGSIRIRNPENQLVARTITLAVTGFLACTIVFFSASVLYNYYAAVKKEPWREAASYIHSLAEPGDLTLVSGQFATNAYKYYASREDPPEEKQRTPQQVKTVSSEMETISAASNANSVWLVLSHLSDDKEKHMKAMLLNSRFQEIYHKRYKATSGHIDVTLFKRARGSLS